VDRELVALEGEDEDVATWSLRLQALAELRALAGAEERPDPVRRPPDRD
jgi:hypothetical protein